MNLVQNVCNGDLQNNVARKYLTIENCIEIHSYEGTNKIMASTMYGLPLSYVDTDNVNPTTLAR